jgi:hypothetical protein
MAAAYLGLAPSQVHNASTVTRISQQIGGAFGTAILAMILTTQLHAHAASGLSGQAAAFSTAFWWLLGFTVMAIIPALALPRLPKRPARRHQPSVRAPQADTPASTDEPELGMTKSPANAKPASPARPA